MKISVMMPVYNMQNYIKEAIESFLNQTLREIELVCIDDCSTDNSREIIENYVKENNNIFLYSTEKNSGVGAVRRMAMELLKGEYIAFLDADDMFCSETVLEILYENAKKGNCDVCGGLVINFSEETVVEYPRFRNVFDVNRGFVDLKYKDIQDDYYFQGFIYRRSFIENRGIEFPSFVRNEDPPFLVRALNEANTVRVVNIEFYAHREGYKKVNYSIDAITDLLNGFIIDMEYADENELDILFNRTVHRLNTEYLEDLVDALKSYDQNFIERLVYMNGLATKRAQRLVILNYFLFLHETNNKIEEFMILRKCEKFLKEYRRIVLYGAGQIGIKVYSVFEEISDCEVVMWVDHYKAGNLMCDKKLCDICDIESSVQEYDVVLIAIGSKEISSSVKKELIGNGVKEKKIIEWTDF